MKGDGSCAVQTAAVEAANKAIIEVHKNGESCEKNLVHVGKLS